MQQINVYGADNCTDTLHTREHLQALGIPHRYVNIEENTVAADQVKSWNAGHRLTPTVVIYGEGDEERLSAPTDRELDAALSRHGLAN